MDAAESDHAWMTLALAEADRAPEHGDVPVGCVVVAADGAELARDHNRREELGDPTAHAEIVALRAASKKIGQWRLEGTIVYVTLEPCPMCAGALLAARVARVVYGAADPKAGACGSVIDLFAEPQLNHHATVRAGVLADESRRLLSSFFVERRELKRQGSLPPDADDSE